MFRKQIGFVLIGATLGFSSTLHAAFLEMPDTTEVPEYEEGSMLLDLEIPGVRERDPDPEAGPRLNVKEFRLQGLVEFPELGITRENLIERVESLRFDLMQEGKNVEGGYTAKELAELADLIAQIDERTQDKHVESVDVQQLVFLIREQRRKRGVTLGMIETVADTITRYYRERGFMLAKAYIPKQHVRDGVVTLTLLLGELGEVRVENNKRYSSKQIRNVFKHDIGKPVTSSNMEEKLYLVNDFPGLAVRGFFQPGSQVGDTELTVNVVEERAFNSNIRIDNEGSEQTGEYRLYADATFNNPWLIGGQLYLSGLSTYEPDNSQYGAIRYNRNIWGPRWRGAMGYSENAFVIGLNEEGGGSETSSGESKVADASVTYVMRRSRAANYSMLLEYRDISTELRFDSEIGSDRTPDKTKTIRLGFNFDIVDDKRQMLHIGNISLKQSKFDPGSESALENRELREYLTYDYSMLTFLGAPFSKAKSRLVVKSSGQYAGKGLASVDQFSLSGVNRVRAFEVNRFFADDAIYLGTDWIFSGPQFGGATIGGEKWSRVLSPFLFFDYGYGIYYPQQFQEGKSTGQFSDIGIGLNFNYKGDLKGSITFAAPIQEDENRGDGIAFGEEDEPEDSSGKVYFNLQYSF